MANTQSWEDFQKQAGKAPKTVEAHNAPLTDSVKLPSLVKCKACNREYPAGTTDCVCGAVFESQR